MNIATDNSKVIADLIKERDELKAHCDFLKECCYMIGNGIKVETSEVNRAPQQSLAEIKAEAIKEAFYEYACEKHGAFGADGSEEEEWGIDKANQLREQAK
jgi:hypothetical protein